MATKEESIFKIIKAGEKGNKYWIQAGKDDFYGGFKDYQGTITDDYSQFLYGNHNEAFKEGDVVKVQYTKSVGKDKDGNDKIYKNLKGIYPASGVPAQTPAIKTMEINPKNPNSISYQPEPVKDEKFWDKKEYKQCLWGYWLEKYAQKAYEARMADGTLGDAEMDTVWQVFKQIEKDADKRFAQGWDKAVKTFGTDEVPLPEIEEQGGPMNVDSIPF